MTLRLFLRAVVVLVFLGIAVLLAARGQPLDAGWGGVFVLVFGAALGVSDVAKAIASRAAAPKLPEGAEHE